MKTNPEKVIEKPAEKEKNPKNLPLPPSPKAKHWFFGNVALLVKDFIRYLIDTEKEVGGIARLTSPLVKLFVVYDPEYIKYVMQDNNKNYTKGASFRHLRPLVGNGLLTSEGDFWRRQRRLAQPAFHKQKLANMVQTMVDCSEKMRDEWLASYKNGDMVNISKEMNKIALTIVSHALFKSDIKGDFGIINRSLSFLLEAVTLRFRYPFIPPIWVPTPFNLKEKAAIRELDRVIHQVIDKKRKSGEKEGEGDLLDMLMDAVDEETGEKMSDKQLRDEVMTLFLAGHETSANALGYLWLLLCENPEVEKKLTAEIDTVLKGKSPVFEDLKNLEYTRMVIHETLRIYPPAYAFERKAIEQDVIGGYRVPKDTNIIISSYVSHHNPKIWENPEAFIPERFEAEKMKKMPRYAYFPFGGGPRLCIGDQFAIFEMLIVIVVLRQKFSFKKPEDYKLRLDPLVTLRPKDDIWLQIQRNVG